MAPLLPRLVAFLHLILLGSQVHGSVHRKSGS